MRFLVPTLKPIFRLGQSVTTADIRYVPSMNLKSSSTVKVVMPSPPPDTGCTRRRRKLVCNLEHLVSRRVDPFEPAIVAIGSFHAGTAPNIVRDNHGSYPNV